MSNPTLPLSSPGDAGGEPLKRVSSPPAIPEVRDSNVPSATTQENPLSERGQRAMSLDQNIAKFNGNVKMQTMLANTVTGTEKFRALQVPESSSASGSIISIFDNQIPGLAESSQLNPQLQGVLNSLSLSDDQKFNKIDAKYEQFGLDPSIYETLKLQLKDEQQILDAVKKYALTSILNSDTNNADKLSKIIFQNLLPADSVDRLRDEFKTDDEVVRALIQKSKIAISDRTTYKQKLLEALKSPPLAIALSLKMDDEKKLLLISSLGLVDKSFLEGLSEKLNGDSHKLISSLKEMQVYKPKEIRSATNDMDFVREYEFNPNQPSQKIISKETINFGDMKVTVSYKIPETNRDENSRREQAFTQLKENIEAEQEALDQVGVNLRDILKSENLTVNDLFKSIGVQVPEISSEMSTEQVNKSSDESRIIELQEKLMEQLDKALMPYAEIAGVNIDLELVKTELIKVLDLEMQGKFQSVDEKTKFAEIYIALDRQIKESKAINPNQYDVDSVGAYIGMALKPIIKKLAFEQLFGDNANNPFFKTDGDIQEEYDKIFKAAFGNRNSDSEIPENQLVTQVIEFPDGKKFEFLPEKVSDVREQIKMPGGVLVRIPGVLAKGNNNPTANLINNGDFSIKVENGFVKMYKQIDQANSKKAEVLVSMLTPSGVRMMMNENWSNNRKEFDMPSVAAVRTLSQKFQTKGLKREQGVLNNKNLRRMRELGVDIKKIRNPQVASLVTGTGRTILWDEQGDLLAEIRENDKVAKFNKPENPGTQNSGDYELIAA